MEASLPLYRREHEVQHETYSGETTTSTNIGEDRTLSPIYEASQQLQHYLAPLELEEAIDEWVQYYNEQRYLKSLDNLNISGQAGASPQQSSK